MVGAVVLARLRHPGGHGVDARRTCESGADRFDDLDTREATFFHGDRPGGEQPALHAQRPAGSRGGAQVVGYVATLFMQARDAGDLAEGVDPSVEAVVYWALVDSLASSTVLGERSVDDAIGAIDYHLGRVFVR